MGGKSLCREMANVEEFKGGEFVPNACFFRPTSSCLCVTMLQTVYLQEHLHLIYIIKNQTYPLSYYRIQTIIKQVTDRHSRYFTKQRATKSEGWFLLLFQSANVSQSYITKVHDRLTVHLVHLLRGYISVTLCFLISDKAFFWGNWLLNIYKDKRCCFWGPTCTEYMLNK